MVASQNVGIFLRLAWIQSNFNVILKNLERPQVNSGKKYFFILKQLVKTAFSPHSSPLGMARSKKRQLFSQVILKTLYLP